MSVCPLKDGRHVRAKNISLHDNGVSVAQEVKEGIYKSECWRPDLDIFQSAWHSRPFYLLIGVLGACLNIC